MEMTVDEALKEVAGGWQPTGECGRVLAAEVERLQKVVADQALTIGTLKDENSKLREENTRMREALGPQATAVMKGEIEDV